MKVAIIDHRASAGGISRFIIALTDALIKNYPNLEIGLFVCDETVKRDSLDTIFHKISNVKIYPLFSPNGYTKSREIDNRPKNNMAEKIKEWLKKSKTIHSILFTIITFYKERILGKNKRWYKFELDKKTIDELNDYDLIYLAWPYFIKPIELKPQIVATFHDFNFMHNFVGNFNPEMLMIIKKQTKEWLKRVHTAITSTEFISNELETFYPNIAKNKKTIFLTSFSIVNPDKKDIEDTLKKFNVPGKYIIYSGGVSRHKNIVNLLKAVSILKKEGKSTPLVITGISTDFIGKKVEFFSKDDPIHGINQALAENGLKVEEDVYPLGYVSNEEVDALTKNSQLVISPSFYEAGCGPALDAWKLGVPVAFSNIPPFLEQLEFLKPKAWIFDPEEPKDIADKINEAITQKEKSQEMARESKEAIDKYTWDDVARGYYEVFRKAIEGE